MRKIFLVTNFCTAIKLLLCHSLHRLVILLGILLTACNSPKQLIGKAYRSMTHTEKTFADSLLLTALDHEAIYTLLDTIKPMSSVQYYKLPLYSRNANQKDSAIAALKNIQNVVNKLSIADWQFVLNPFAKTDSIYRATEIYVFRKSRLANLIAQQQQYFGQWGFTPNANPATILAVTEYEQKYTRWRSYGYLFGYPNYAVDFFVEAGKAQDSTKEFVKRDFFAIPVYAGDKGHFTYAVPKGYQTTQADSAIYNKAIITLDKYKIARKKFGTKKGIKAFKIFQKFN
jgi:hypothetical protein